MGYTDQKALRTTSVVLKKNELWFMTEILTLQFCKQPKNHISNQESLPAVY